MSRSAHRFGRVELRRRARGYVLGLLAPLADKNSWTIAEAAGDSTPDGMQRLLNAARWDADAVAEDLRSYVAEHLGAPDGVLIIDDTGFLKKGVKSAGVQRQYTGTAGRTENCQIGVFAAYASTKGRTLVDRELYLPGSWFADQTRCAEASIADHTTFATKPALAVRILDRTMAAGVLPVRWVTADEAYGRDPSFRHQCIATGSAMYWPSHVIKRSPPKPAAQEPMR